MEEESTAKLLSIKGRPAAPRDPITFIKSLDLRAFPADARRRSGFQLRRVQQGLDPDD